MVDSYSCWAYVNKQVKFIETRHNLHTNLVEMGVIVERKIVFAPL